MGNFSLRSVPHTYDWKQDCARRYSKHAAYDTAMRILGHDQTLGVIITRFVIDDFFVKYNNGVRNTDSLSSLVVMNYQTKSFVSKYTVDDYNKIMSPRGDDNVSMNSMATLAAHLPNLGNFNENNENGATNSIGSLVDSNINNNVQSNSVRDNDTATIANTSQRASQTVKKPTRTKRSKNNSKSKKKIKQSSKSKTKSQRKNKNKSKSKSTAADPNTVTPVRRSNRLASLKANSTPLAKQGLFFVWTHIPHTHIYIYIHH